MEEELSEKSCEHKFVYVKESLERVDGTSEFTDAFSHYHYSLCQKCGEIRRTEAINLRQ